MNLLKTRSRTNSGMFNFGSTVLGLAAVSLLLVSSTRAETEIHIGLMTELSGTFAANGENCRQGYEIARSLGAQSDRLGQYKLNFHYADSRGEGKTALSEFNKLLEADDILALVTNRSQVGMPLNPVSKQKQVPLIGIVAHPDFAPQNPYAFRFWYRTEDEARVLAGKALSMGLKKFSVVTLEDEYLLALTSNFKKDLESRGAKIVAEETVQESQSDLSSVVTKLYQSKPDAIFVNLGISQLGVVFKKISEQGIRIPLLTNYWVQTGDVRKVAGDESLEGVLFVELDTNQPKFMAKLKELFKNEHPSAINYTCYCALMTVLTALSEDQEVKDRQSMYQALLKVESVELLDQTLEIRDREARFVPVIKSIVSGKVIQLD